MNKSRIAAVLLAVTLNATSSVQAHHGPGQFNGGDVTVTGKVTEIRFVNPHAYVHFDVIDENGNSKEWRCQLGAGSGLRRAGWSQDMFPIGEEITVRGDAGTSERTACSFQSAILADGREIERSTQIRTDIDNKVEAESKLVSGTLDLNGTWASPQLYFRIPDADTARGMGGAIGAMGAGGPPPMGAAGAMEPRGAGGMGARPLTNGMALTEAGTAAVARYTESGGGNPRHRCEVSNIFHDWTFNDHVNEIIQTKESITMKFGFMDIVRTIHLNMDEHPENIVPSVAGHSIGRLDGNTLHVDTKGFINDGYLTPGLIHSDQFHVTETFTYKEGDNSLTRKYSAVDPINYTGTYSGEDVVFVSNTPFEEYACVELTDDYIEPID